MKKFLLLLIPLLSACANPGNVPQNQGSFQPFAWSNAGPGHPLSINILVQDPSGATVSKFQTDSFGTGIAFLAPGSYRWGPADSTWNFYHGDSLSIIEGGRYQMVDSLVWPLTIHANEATIDTIIFCPMCL